MCCWLLQLSTEHVQTIEGQGRIWNVSLKDVMPKRIHQIWTTTTNQAIPGRWDASRKSWEIKNGNYVFTLWTDSMLNEFFAKEYHWFLGTYKSYYYDVQRADAARLFLLYHFGGVYSDMDIVCRRPIDELLAEVKPGKTIIIPATKPFGLATDVILVIKRHPFLWSAILSLKSTNRWYGIPYLTEMLSTGPLFLTEHYRQYSGKESVFILPEQLYTRTYFGHVRGESWHQWDGRLIWWLWTRSWKQWAIGAMIFFASLTLFCVFLMLMTKCFIRYKNSKVCHTALLLAEKCRIRRVRTSKTHEY